MPPFLFSRVHVSESNLAQDNYGKLIKILSFDKLYGVRSQYGIHEDYHFLIYK
jgi:hypothetical protein